MTKPDRGNPLHIVLLRQIRVQAATLRLSLDHAEHLGFTFGQGVGQFDNETLEDLVADAQEMLETAEKEYRGEIRGR